MNRILEPNDEKGPEDELVEEFRSPQPLDEDGDLIGARDEETTLEGESVLDEFSEDISSSPAERGRPDL